MITKQVTADVDGVSGKFCYERVGWCLSRRHKRTAN